MNPELKRFEIETAILCDYDFPIEDTASRELCAQGIDQLGKISVQRFRVAALNQDLVSVAEEQRAKLKQEVEKLLLVAKEAEETKQQLTLRTAERDNLQGQFEQLRKGIRSLLGQAEAATRTPAQPAISTTETLAPSKSY